MLRVLVHASKLPAPTAVRVLALFLLLPAGACAPEAPEPTGPPPPPPRIASADTVDVRGVTAARAEIEGAVTGTVTLRGFPDGTRILMDLDGLRPNRYHGVQILSIRTCEGATEAGLLGEGRASHGPYDAPAGRRLSGGLGNIMGDDRGRGRFDRIDPNVTLTGYLSAVDRAVVIRERQDDGWTEPSGGAGDVIGCGTLRAIR
ncbi:MAG: superoxide dismutase family protein [Bacteroidota bacterium]